VAGSKTLDAEKKKPKAALLDALKASFAISDAAFVALTDAQANEVVTMGQSGFQLSQAVASREHDRPFQRAARLHGGLSQAQGQRAAVHGGDERWPLAAGRYTLSAGR
jgi:hypothetical protein